MDENIFRTQKGYDLNSEHDLTLAMEDYLEMICRNLNDDNYIRVSTLANLLNVQASSASKMVSNLKKLGLVDYEKYGVIKPTERGNEYGSYFLYRHKVLNEFFCYLNGTESELKQVEQIEHYLTYSTVKNIEKLLSKLKKEDSKI